MKIVTWGTLCALFVAGSYCQTEEQIESVVVDDTMTQHEGQHEAEEDMVAAEEEWAFRHSKVYGNAEVRGNHFVLPVGSMTRRAIRHDQTLKDHANNLHTSEIAQVEGAQHFDENNEGDEKPHRFVGNP